MKQLLPCLIAIPIVMSCHKENDSSNIYQSQLEAHQWVLDSSNTKTFTAGSSEGVITRIKGDSSATLTYHKGTFDEAKQGLVTTKNYRVSELTIYYWDLGAKEDKTKYKTFSVLHDSILMEQVIIDDHAGNSTNSFNFYHAH